MKKPFEWIGGRDLSFKLQCTCPDKSMAHRESVAHLFKTVIRLSGYADDNFFDNVNKEPRKISCECGRSWMVQWFRDGVVANKTQGENRETV